MQPETVVIVQETVTIDITQPNTVQPVADASPVAESSDTASTYVKPRGSFADSVARETEVNQELLDPSIINGGKSKGVQRI